MAFYDNLKNQDAQNLIQAVAYGRHVARGVCAKTKMTGTAPNQVLTLQQILGVGPWSEIEAVYYSGLYIDPAKWRFYPGIKTTGPSDPVQPVDSVFSTDVPHSLTAWIRVELPTGVGPDTPGTTTPDGLTVIAKTLQVENYDSSGNEIGADYSPNPARIVADLIIKQGGIDKSRINWPAWVAWRDFCDAPIWVDYTKIPGFRGFGLTGRFYDGTNFDTFVSERIDPYIDFGPSSGAPALGIGTDTYSVRWEGKIRAKYTETYTFKVLHDNGAKLWVNGTLVVDQWGTTETTTGHTGTIALTRGEFYDIKLEWFDDTGTAQIQLKWSSSSQTEELIPDDVLYPKPAWKPRYEAHPFFAAPTRLDDAIRTVLAISNSYCQDAGGKLTFAAFDQAKGPAFHFDADNIVANSITVTPRDPRQVRNVWVAKFRDLDSQYLEAPLTPITIERDTLIEIAGRRIDGDSIEFFNSNRHQVYRVLNELAKRVSDPLFTFEFAGLPDTWPVLPGDWVTADFDFLDFTGVNLLVISANDSSPESSADERSFVAISRLGKFESGQFTLIGRDVGFTPRRLAASSGSFKLGGKAARLAR